MKKLSYVDKVKKQIMTDMRLRRIPLNTKRIKPIFHTCSLCKKNPVTHHHFLCDKCWDEKNLVKKKKRYI